MWLLRLGYALKAKNFTLLVFEISFVAVSTPTRMRAHAHIYTHACARTRTPTHTYAHVHTRYCRRFRLSGKNPTGIIHELLKLRQNSISKNVTAS